MKIFDSHCHLNDRAYRSDRNAVIDRARQAGVTAMMIVGITEKTSSQAIDIAAAHAGCYASVGIHPHDAQQCSEAALDRLQQLAASPHVKAWGETGLDFNRMHSPKADQEKWFARQLEIGGELGLPLIFHERDSEGRFFEIVKAHAAEGQKGVVHCFSGTRGELERYLEMGFYIGVTGIVTIKSRGRALRDMAATIPADRIVVETDAPYLTPAPEKNQTQRNEPAFVRHVLLKLAEVRKTDPEQLAAAVWENTRTLFDIND
ncbi:MAG: TatD family hydrolase [Thermodesulfobacteriota bacterium]